MILLIFMYLHIFAIVTSKECNYGERRVAIIDGRICVPCADCPVGRQPKYCNLDVEYSYPLDNSCVDCEDGYYNDLYKNTLNCKKCTSCHELEKQVCNKTFSSCEPKVAEPTVKQISVIHHTVIHISDPNVPATPLPDTPETTDVATPSHPLSGTNTTFASTESRGIESSPKTSKENSFPVGIIVVIVAVVLLILILIVIGAMFHIYSRKKKTVQMRYATLLERERLMDLREGRSVAASQNLENGSKSETNGMNLVDDSLSNKNIDNQLVSLLPSSQETKLVNQDATTDGSSSIGCSVNLSRRESTSKVLLLKQVQRGGDDVVCGHNGCQKKLGGPLLIELSRASVIAISEDLVKRGHDEMIRVLRRLMQLLHKEKSYVNVESLEELVVKYLAIGRTDMEIKEFVAACRFLGLDAIIDEQIHHEICEDISALE